VASQAASYGALLAGGVVLTAAATGHSLRDILAGKHSPIRGLISEPPPVGSSMAPAGFSAIKGSQSTVGALARGSGGAVGNAAQMIRWAKATLGTQEGSAAQQKWAQAAGVAASAPWCSVWVAYGLKRMGVTPPANPAYSGTWLEGWSGGTNLHTTSLRSARPGDLLIFDWGDGGQTDHVALYTGGGKMIGGNQSNEVSMIPVPTGNIVGIVRPHYPAGKQKKKPRTQVSGAPIAGRRL
jgi:hypothetical protein